MPLLTTRPLIRLAIVSLYGALTLPLPFFLASQAEPIIVQGFSLGLVAGGLFLWILVSQTLRLDDQGLRMSYLWGLGPSWSLKWSDIIGIRASGTSQGGQVYYLIGKDGRQWLLPMRIHPFTELTRILQERTSLNTDGMQAWNRGWMYGLVMVCAGILLVLDGFLIQMALTVGSGRVS